VMAHNSHTKRALPTVREGKQRVTKRKIRSTLNGLLPQMIRRAARAMSRTDSSTTTGLLPLEGGGKERVRLLHHHHHKGSCRYN
jgi:hypothetical protein